MDDLKMAWRNIWRNKRRSILTILAIVFASTLLVFMLSFQFGSYEDMINASVRLNTGHIQIMAAGYHDDQKIRKVITSPDTLMKKAVALPSVKGAAKRLEGFCLASSADRTKGVMITGVNPGQEKTVSRLSDSMQQGAYLDIDDYDTAIIGYLLARRLRLKIGDEITILGQGRDGSVAAAVVTVKGIFKSGIDAFDKNIIQVPYSFFNVTFYMENSAHRLVFLLDSLKNLPRARNKLVAMINPDTMDILTWDELMPGLKQSISLDLISGLIMYFILIIVVSFSILNTFLMSILERKREYGVLLAIGTTPLRLIKFVLTESMLMTLTGLIIGMAAGAAITAVLSVYGISLGEASSTLSQYGISDRLYPKLSWLSLFAGPALIFVTTFVTALIPALRIKKLRPFDAMTAI